MNDDVKKRAEVVKYNGVKYVRINPEDINISKMTLVRKVTDVVAAQIKKGQVRVVTRHGKEIETINMAKAGDWIVYDIGGSNFKSMIDKLLNCEKSAITKENFAYLYRASDEPIVVDGEEQLRLVQDLVMDNDDTKDFDATFVNSLKRYKYIGKPVYAGYVPFNFVLRAPWGEDQYIKRGGLVIYDSNFEKKRTDNKKDYEQDQIRESEIYGIEGAKNRTPGIFEKTYSLAPGSEQTIIADTFKMAIQADRSPIAGIQFNNVDMAKAYERAGKAMPEFLAKFLD